jgi:hypothetical protein
MALLCHADGFTLFINGTEEILPNAFALKYTSRPFSSSRQLTVCAYGKLFQVTAKSGSPGSYSKSRRQNTPRSSIISPKCAYPMDTPCNNGTPSLCL